MVDHVWHGGAPAVAQVDTITLPADVEAGQVFKASIGAKVISYTFPPGPTVQGIAAAIVELLNGSTIPEFLAVTAVDNSDGSFSLTAETPGQPFIVSFRIGDGTNEIQTITLGNNPAGGTFTLEFDGQTTAPIAFDADAATVQAALEELSNIDPGDIAVTGDAGGSWEIEFIGNLADTDVALITGDATNLDGVDEQQTITLNSATGGTFTLEFDGETTDPIAFNASAATVESDLEGLSSIGAGNVSVSGDAGGPYTVVFTGALGSTDVGLITIDGTNLTGTVDAGITETNPGAGGVSEVWNLFMYNQSAIKGLLGIAGNVNVTAGTFTIKIQTGGGQTLMQTGDIAFDATAGEVTAAFEATNYGKAVGGLYPLCFVAYGGDDRLSEGGSYTLHLHPVVENPDEEYTLEIDSTSLTGGSYSEDGVGGFGGLNSTAPTNFTSFYIDIDGETTDDIDFNASAATITAALEALPNVGPGNITVMTSAPTNSYAPFCLKLSFIGDLANQETGFAINIRTHAAASVEEDEIPVTTGDSGTAEVQTLSITGSPGSGTFGLTFGGDDTGPLAYSSDAASIQTALEALDSIGTGNVVCTGGPLPDTPVVITFVNALGGTDLSSIDVINGTVTVAVEGGQAPTIEFATTQTVVGHVTTTANEGPNDWNTASNWDTGIVPGNGDNVIVLDGDDILYGMDQSGVTLNRLEIYNYETQIGLPRRNADGGFEYLPRFLSIGAAEIIIGLGDGNGSNRINLDIGMGSPAIEIRDSGTGESGESAIQIIGVNATNTASLLLLEGEVGIATYPKQAAHFEAITQRGGELSIGPNVTILGLTKTEGEFKADRTTVDGVATL